MRKILLAAVLVLMASGAQAVTLNVIGGILHGASGVDVGGTLYDVEFVDGTCSALFDGCNEPSSFLFNTTPLAIAASQALHDLIENSVFDRDSRLTAGCSDFTAPGACGMATPIGVSPATGFPHNSPVTSQLSVMIASNRGYPGSDTINFESQQCPGPCVGSDSLLNPSRVWAVWSPIPEPSTALLLGLGLVGMAARRRV